MRIVGESASADKDAALRYPSNTKELDNESLLNIEEQRAYEEEEKNLSDDAEKWNEIPSKEITHEQLAKIITCIETLSDEIMEIDPNFDRSTNSAEILKMTLDATKICTSKRSHRKNLSRQR